MLILVNGFVQALFNSRTVPREYLYTPLLTTAHQPCESPNRIDAEPCWWLCCDEDVPETFIKVATTLSQVPQTLVDEFTSHFMNIMQFCYKILPRKVPCASDLAKQITCEAIPLRGSEGKWARFAPLHLIVFSCF